MFTAFSGHGNPGSRTLPPYTSLISCTAVCGICNFVLAVHVPLSWGSNNTHQFVLYNWKREFDFWAQLSSHWSFGTGRQSWRRRKVSRPKPRYLTHENHFQLHSRQSSSSSLKAQTDPPEENSRRPLERLNTWSVFFLFRFLYSPVVPFSEQKTNALNRVNLL